LPPFGPRLRPLGSINAPSCNRLRERAGTDVGALVWRSSGVRTVAQARGIAKEGGLFGTGRPAELLGSAQDEVEDKEPDDEKRLP
jgi:hypothetical protein